VSGGFNSALASGIQTQAPSATVIWADSTRLVAAVSGAVPGGGDADKVLAEGTRYFLASELVDPGLDARTGARKYLFPFFDNTQHPTVAAHKLTAQYVQSVVESPTRVAIVRETPLAMGHKVASGTRRLAETLFLAPMAGDWSFDVQGDFGHSHTGVFTRKELGFRDGRTWNGEFSLNRKVCDRLVVGGRLNYGHNTLKFAADKGDATLRETALSLHGVYTFEQPVFLFATLGAGRLDATINRQIALGQAVRTQKGTPMGSHFFGSAGAGYRFSVDENTFLVPWVSAHAQAVSLRSYQEKGDLQSTTMSFDMPSRKSLVGEVGARIEGRYKVQDNLTLMPAFSVSYSYDFQDAFKDRIKGRVSDMPTWFKVPYAKMDRSSMNLEAGVTGLVNERFTVGLTVGAKPTGRVRAHSASLNAAVRF
jgi:uncharacterized protein YhjY with autotransporter beta-barrel domain